MRKDMKWRLANAKSSPLETAHGTARLLSYPDGCSFGMLETNSPTIRSWWFVLGDDGTGTLGIGLHNGTSEYHHNCPVHVAMGLLFANSLEDFVATGLLSGCKTVQPWSI